MKRVDIAWQKDAERFLATGAGGKQVVVNAPHLDEATPRTGISPADLLLIAAGTCSGWDVVEILRKQQQTVDEIEVEVTGEQDGDPPWAFRRIALHFTIRGRGISLDLAERAVRLSEEQYCSVTATIRGGATVTSDVAVFESPAPGGGSGLGGDPASRGSSARGVDPAPDGDVPRPAETGAE